MAAKSHPSTVLTATEIRAAVTAASECRSHYPRPVPIPEWKRPVDWAILLVLSPLLAPVMLLITLAIKVLSKGPTFFRQERIGYGGRPFQILKFRTMKVDADVQVHSNHLDQLMRSNTPMTKLDSVDSRLIPGGRWLRATGLDELPQLLNVLKGEMSFVGPRPCMEYEAERYDMGQKRRFGALPGLTGLWQVSGKNRLPFQEMIRLDVCYVENPSLLLDLKILFKTPLAILSQVGDTVGSRQQISNSVGETRTSPGPDPE